MHDPFYDLFPRPPVPAFADRRVALVTIDLQYLDAHRDGWIGRIAKAQGQEALLEPRFRAIDAILPNVRRVQDAFRAAGQEVIHVRVGYRTANARDAGTAYMPHPGTQPTARDARDDELLPEVAAKGDEMIFAKTSASMWSSTAIDSVLRRMGIDHLVFTGIVTDGCVELSARDASDRGYAVTLVSDGCSASTPEAHDDALQRMTDGGFVVADTADRIVERVRGLSTPAGGANG
jgi:nicotinamidase-related amidase